MAKCGKEILLAREGTEQIQRFLDALNPESVKLNDFGLEEWMQFAYRFAEHVNYFDINNSEISTDDWTDFFKSKDELEAFLETIDNGKNVTSHLALFVSFLKLLESTQKRFNNLTKRHLDFYYKNILQIEKLPATPDKVHIIFELAKISLSEQINKYTGFDGGKDSTGKKLTYKTTEELIANKIKVAQLKNVYNDLNSNKLKAAEVANSFDGIGGDFPNNDIKWWPFGYFNKTNPDDEISEYPALKNAKIGFALASEIFELKEGLRNILITVEFNTNLKSNISQEMLQSNLEVYFSGEKKWLGPFSVQSEAKEDDHAIFYSGLNTTKNLLKIAFQIPKEEEEIVSYDSKILGESFNTNFPVIRVLINTENADGHKLYENLFENEIKNIKVNIDVRGVKSLELESDIGKFNSEKPFYPFSTQPVRKSNFYIGYPELFKKEWKSLDVEIEWKNTPNTFRELYYAYREKHKYKVTPSTYLEGLGELFLPEAQQALFMAQFGENGKSIGSKITALRDLTFVPNEEDLIVKNDNYFKANVEIQNKEDWESVDKNIVLFTKSADEYKTKFSVSKTNYEEDKNGQVRLSIAQSFLHDLFPRIYALALSSEKKDAIIPNEPYTPFAETITLNYTAESTNNFGKTKLDFSSNKVALFHEHPFGQTEEHPYLKSKLDFLNDNDNNNFLVPTYNKGGELFIGLENVGKLQTVSLLVQVLEGSENPQAESFEKNEKVEWSVLCNNYWKVLDSDYMISNETDNFLKSGIVKFSIPREATSTNTLLPEKLVWVKAKIHKNFNAVCKTIDIVAQSILAEFTDNKNELSHLENGMAAKTISKLTERVATVKSVSQPFNSFDGKPQESDEAYYRRISERLRHKNRAITLWDYEHIILQQFPEIHKVKCLNHSSQLSFLSPGNVLIVVIPDIVNKNVFDIYQPRVSKATLNAVQNWVNKLNTLHVNAKVINPDYEEVTVELKVKFHKGFDENYYAKVLNKDITKLLSPWAFEDTASIEFGITLHRSVVINYIENLKYVDYIEDVKFIKGGEISTSNVAPSSPIAILVSAKEHEISVEVKICSS
ncbi:MAG: phage baseplate protein [Draconibacterium sp.]|nr:phage baseplate protein [Draconibacterium sp.]